MTPIPVPLKKENREIKRQIEVDGETSTLRVELINNNENGTYSITTKLTTIQVSRNEEVQDAVIKQLTAMLKKAMAGGIAFRDEWNLNNSSDAKSPKIPFPEDRQDVYGEATGQEDEEGESTKLSLDAAPVEKKKRGRPAGVKASNATEKDIDEAIGTNVAEEQQEEEMDEYADAEGRSEQGGDFG